MRLSLRGGIERAGGDPGLFCVGEDGANTPCFETPSEVMDLMYFPEPSWMLQAQTKVFLK